MSLFLTNRLRLRSLTLVAFETVFIVGAVAIAAYVRLGAATWDVLLSESGVFKTLLVAFVSQVCLYYVDLYDLRIASDRRELFIRMIQALVSASFILAALYFWFPPLIIGRGVFFIAASIVVVLAIGWRFAF